MKIKELQKILQQKKIDAALFLNYSSDNSDPNFVYFTQKNLDFTFFIVPKSGRSYFIVPKMIYPELKNIKFKKILWNKKNDNLLKIMKKRHPVKTIAINKRYITLSLYKYLKKHLKRVEIKDISNECSKLRVLKTKKEILNYKKAARITDEIIQSLIKNIKKIKTEKEAIGYLKMQCWKRKCEVAFEPIIASGSNGAEPHHKATGKLKKGFCIIDFGIKYKHYRTDITRTIYNGKPSQNEIDDYNLVLLAQQKLIKSCKQGITCKKLYEDSLKLLKHRARYFTHGLGHGIGLEIHELPNIGPKSKEKLQPNMIFTIEPAIYLPNKYGIRIEDNILLTKRGPVTLTKTPKKLKIIS